MNYTHLPAPLPAQQVTTALELPGFEVVQNLGIVRGIVVRSRSIVGSFGAAIQMVFGGNITIFSKLCEEARSEAYNLMVQHAAELGAEAIIGFRYDTTEITAGVTEVLAYGTAVQITRTTKTCGNHRKN
jgi:uncharacterized protein YbjQ (UPF0145 family)